MLKAHAQVETPKAERYLKALCNHFSHKVTAEYDDRHGTVQFGFGTCEMDADGHLLRLHVGAVDAENFTRVKAVVADHLERFSGDEALRVTWQDHA
jgi:hypothetical protein